MADPGDAELAIVAGGEAAGRRPAEPDLNTFRVPPSRGNGTGRLIVVRSFDHQPTLVLPL
jgi:hypothetical protein